MKQYFINLAVKIKQFTDSLYLFRSIPPVNTKAILIFLISFSTMVILGIIAWFYLNRLAQKTKPYEELRNRLTSLFLTCGILGLMWTFFYWQSIPYLASAMLAFMLLVIFLIWLLLIFVYIQRQFSWELVEFERQERYKKYLPRPQRRGGPNPKQRRNK